MILIAGLALGWLPSGVEARSTLWIWLAVVALHGLWRAVARPDPDPIRPSGPVG